MQNYTNFPCYQSNAQNSPSQASTVCEQWTSRSSKKQESSRKTSTSASLTALKPLSIWITKTCGKLLKRWEYQISLTPSWETCMQVRKQQLQLDMEQQTGFKIGKGACQGCLLSPCLFNLHSEYLMRNAGLDKTHARIKIVGKISITSDMQMIPLLWQKVKRN